MDQPPQELALSILQRSDGSASVEQSGYTVVASVNGPVEAQKRVELPSEAVLDVVVTPDTGVGGVREKYLESLVQSALCQVILRSAHPRTLIQITLQIVRSPNDGQSGMLSNKCGLDIALLPTLLGAATLALLTSSIPLRMILTSTLVAVDECGTLISNPSAESTQIAASLHFFCFSSLGHLLLTQSVGRFSVEEWEEALQQATVQCRGNDVQISDSGEDSMMEPTPNLENNIKTRIAKQLLEQQRWKDSLV